MSRGPKLLAGVASILLIGLATGCDGSRQGPDSYFSRDAFQRYFPGQDINLVNDVYAVEENVSDGHVVTLRIGLPSNLAAQEEMIQAMVAQYSLTKLTGGEATGARVLPAPDWFPDADHLHTLPEAFGRGSIFLWIDRAQENDEDPEATEDDPSWPARAYFQQTNLQ